MAQAGVRALLARHKKAESAAGDWRAILNEIYEYAMPQRNILQSSRAGQIKGTKVYNSTAISSTMNFANRIQSDMMPPFQRWITLELGEGMKGEDEQLEQQAEEILEEVGEKLYAVMSSSNFNSAVNEMLIDLAAGTGAMLIQAGNDRQPVIYTALPIAQLSLEEGANGTVSGVYRRHKIKARNIMATWGDAELPAELLKLLAENKNDVDIEVVECSYQDVDEDLWRYEVLCVKEKARIVSRTSKESPIVVPRWIKIAGEVFGRGVLTQALPDIKTLNAVTKMILQNASLAIAGAYMVADDGVVNPNTLQIKAGAFIPVSRTAGVNGATIAPIPRSGDFNVGELEREQLTNSVKKMLFDENLPPQTGSVRSATEIIERVKELSRTIGAPFGRIMQEFIVPMVRRTLEVMADAEIIDGALEVDGNIVKLKVTSPLAHNQSLSDVDAVVRWLEIMLGTVGEEAVNLGAKTEDLAEYLGEKLGVPVELIRSKQERDEIQAKQQENADQERNMAMAQAEAQLPTNPAPPA